MIGELVCLQRDRASAAQTKKSKVTAFNFCQGETNYAAIPIPRHKDSDEDEVFKLYQYK